MPQICVIDDSVSGVGGTSLTLNAIMAKNVENIEFIPTSDLSLKDVFKPYDLFILGNIMGYNNNSFDALMHLMSNCKFVKIEFDYGYCPYRGLVPHKILGKEECSCPFGKTGDPHLSKIYSRIKSQSSYIFYMSDGQMNMHDIALGGIDKNKKSRLSSCFSEENMLLMDRLKSKKKNDKYAIIDGKGGWHTQAKGIKESIEYAKENNLSFDLIKTETHKEMLNLLSEYKGLISMPIIHDTCPRITIEAKFMGLEVITNEMSQHTTELWWQMQTDDAVNYIKGRPKFFWDKIKCLK